MQSDNIINCMSTRTTDLAIKTINVRIIVSRPVHDYLQQQLEMSKYIMKKDVSIRSRAFKSAMVQRNRIDRSGGKKKEQRLPATPALPSTSHQMNNPEPFMDGL